MPRLLASCLAFSTLLAAPHFIAAQTTSSPQSPSTQTEAAPIERHTPQVSTAAAADAQQAGSQQSDQVQLDPRNNDRTGPMTYGADYGSGYYAGGPPVVYGAPGFAYGYGYPYAYPYGFGYGFGVYGYPRPYGFYGFRGPYGYGGPRGGFIGGRGFSGGGGFRGGPGRR